MPFLGTATLHDVLDLAFPTPGAAPPARAAVILEAARATARAGDPEGDPSPADPCLQHGSYVEGVIHLAVHLAEALAFLHARQVYHRDLKPSNVLLGPDGRALLLDFNLSADPTRAAPHLGGTVPYMAPEQVRAFLKAEAGPPDLDWAQADLFSLGVILYELLTGAHPFGPVPLGLPPAELGADLLALQQARSRPLRSLNPAVGRHLAELIERCLAFDPAGRPASAAELAAGLGRYFSRPQRLRRWAARRAGLLCGLGCLLLAAVAAAGWSAWNRPPHPERQDSHGGVAVPTPDPIEAPSDFAEHQYKRGVEAFRKGDYASAVGHFSQGLHVDQAHPRCRFGRGCAWMLRSHHVGGPEGPQFAGYAKEDFERGNLNPDAFTSACLAYCYNRIGNLERAEHYSRKASGAGLRSPAVLNNWAWSCLQQPDQPALLEEAGPKLKEALHKLLGQDPSEPSVRAALGAAYYNRALLARARWDLEQKGRRNAVFPDAALEDIERAIERLPPTDTLFWNAAQLYAMSALGESRKMRQAEKAQQVLHYLDRAVQYGYPPDQLARNLNYLSLLRSDPKFEELCRTKPRPTSALTAPRLVPPVWDLPDGPPPPTQPI
jgi:tetratricopeptide (TPR) repeat protein